MATYSEKGSTNSSYTLELSVWEISYDIASNTSNVGWQLTLYSTGYNFSYHTLKWKLLIDNLPIRDKVQGSGYLYPATIGKNSLLVLDSGTLQIQHNADGKKSIYCYVDFKSTSGSYMPGAIYLDGTLPLTDIPRTSGVSCNSFNIGDATTIVISSADASLRHTLTWHFGNNSGTIATKTSATTIGYTILSSSLYSQIPNAQVGAGTITCHTYSGDTLIGTSTCGFNAYAKEAECKPSVSVSVVDINDTTIALTGSNQKLIKGFSTALVSVSATPKNSSSITGYYISTGNGRVSYASSASFANITANNFYGQASDSRGYATGVSVSKTWIDYVYLAFTKIEIKRPESTADEATMTIQGNYWNGNFGNKNNSLTLQYRYKEDGGEYSEWTSLTPTISGNTFSYTQLIQNLDHNTEYIFQFMIDDELMTIYSKEQDGVLTKGIPVLRVGKDYVKINGTKTVGADVMTINATRHVQGFDTAWVFHQINSMYVHCSTGNKLILENNSIKIGKGISKVLVSGEVSWNHTATTDRIVSILKNSNYEIVNTYDGIASGNYITSSIAPYETDVAENDIIQIGITTGANGYTESEFLRAWLTVQVVE